MSKLICCICEKEIVGHDCNPAPFKGNKCCQTCDNKYVTPLRLALALNQAVLFGADNSLTIIKPESKKFKLKELQKCVGGLIEFYPTNVNKYKVIVNEEGLLRGLPKNELMSKYLGLYIVGDVLLAPGKELE